MNSKTQIIKEYLAMKEKYNLPWSTKELSLVIQSSTSITLDLLKTLRNKNYPIPKHLKKRYV